MMSYFEDRHTIVISDADALIPKFQNSNIINMKALLYSNEAKMKNEN